MGPAANVVQARLIRWSEFQAGAMLAVISLVLFRRSLPGIMLAPGVSFGLLIAWNRDAWTPKGGFGATNATTLLRLLAILSLLALPSLALLPQFALALSALALDGIDGWLARRLGLCSEFGATFDQEVDAVFTLVLGILLFRKGLLGPWILIPGGLRYAFVLFVRFAHPPALKATGTLLGKLICVVVLAALLLCLLPLGPARAPVAIAATLLLSGSFARSLRQMYQPG